MTTQSPRRFAGFTSGSTAVNLPSQFFTELLPMIDDEAELRVTIFALRSIAQRRGALRAVTLSQLAADPALQRSLAGCGGVEVITGALNRAAQRGGLLLLPLAGDDVLCFQNSVAGRRLRDRVRLGAFPLPPGMVAQVASPVPTADSQSPARVYEEEIGALSPAVAEALAAAIERWSPQLVVKALHVAAHGNVRRWSYAEAVLRRWEAEGGEDAASNDPALREAYEALTRRS